MKNPNGPSREDVDAWKDAAEDSYRASQKEEQAESVYLITCPKCGENVADKKTRDELTIDWHAECECGWWRKISLPIEEKC